MNDEYELTAPRAIALYNALKAAGDFLTRQQLAERTGKYRLSPNDVRHLSDMVRAGLIDEGTIPAPNVIGGSVLAYRVRGE